jgi:hypothetical protein
MAEEKEPFLSRWSRRKAESSASRKEPERTGGGAPASAAAVAPAEAGAPAPAVLPALETLTPQSDFAPFMQRGVEEALRRAALKKLFFSDPHFNVPDPYESHSIDWTGGSTPGSEIVAKLERAREKLAGAQQSPPEPSSAQAGAGGEDAAGAREQPAQSAASPQTDEGGGQDGVARQDA